MFFNKLLDLHMLAMAGAQECAKAEFRAMTK
jgi:hypothetical protein